MEMTLIMTKDVIGNGPLISGQLEVLFTKKGDRAFANTMYKATHLDGLYKIHKKVIS
jgi:hypothetical protein